MNNHIPTGFYTAPSPVAPSNSQQTSVSHPPVRPSVADSKGPHPRSSYRCEPCQLDFDSPAALQAHTASHVTCDECDFCAAPKVVKGHYQAKHGKFSTIGFKTVTVAVPGCPVQRFRICVGNRPEDVQQWIAERKKRFPRRHPVAAEGDKDSTTTYNTSSKVAPTPRGENSGLSSLLQGYGSSSSDDEEEQEKPQPTVATKNIARIDQDPQEDGKEHRKDSHQPEISIEPSSHESSRRPTQPSRRTLPCHVYERYGSCPRGNQCPYEHIPKKGLLARLLEQDQQRETLLTLQLLDYINETSFLQNKPS